MPVEPGGTVATSPAPLSPTTAPRAFRWNTRQRDAVVCTALTLLALLQAPGKITADTKIDLVLNPMQWLDRSLRLWDPAGFFGEVQDQAYGYLWPMGPFFALGHLIDLPPWIIQRLWWALLFAVAYLGVVRLLEKLAIGTPTSRLIAGIAFALSPRILTEIGQVSVEAWPTAVAPWVLLPLIGLASGSSIRRAVSLSGVALICAGGVNATAVAATLPLAGLWLLTLQPLRRRVLAIVAWVVAVLAATAWWLVPLVILGKYSPPFLDYIENAITTTWVTDPVTVLRGASYWPAWIDDSYGPIVPPGWAIARTPIPAIGTMVLAAIGLIGLARRGMPHRRLWVAGLLVGFTLVSLGHAGQMPLTFNAGIRVLLDGALAPLRNMHKFDVIVRLPLTLGLAHIVGLLLRWRARRAATPAPATVPATPAARSWWAPARRPGVVAAGVTLLAMVGVAVPALEGGLAAPRSFSAVPSYWTSAATWLNAHDDGTVLVLPGARFPRYTWGDTLDEVTQPLVSGPVVVRSVIPLAPPSTIRMMDTIEAALATGYGAPGLADYLARAGVSYLLIRNDIDYGRTDTTSTELVHQALARSPGLEQVVSFGPQVTPPTADGQLDQLGLSVPALQILKVDRPVDKIVAYPVDQTTTVVGGPEALLGLADTGLLPAGPVVLAGDLASTDPSALPGGAADLSSGPVVITDSLRLIDRSFGSGRDPDSTTLTPQQADAAQAHDLLPTWGPQWTTSAAYLGIAGVSASSSRSDMQSDGSARPDELPFAVIDDDPTTAWYPASHKNNAGQWVQVDLTQPTPLPQVTLHFVHSSLGQVTRVTVDTGHQSLSLDVSGDTLTVPLDGAPVSSVRVTIDDFTELVKDQFIAAISALDLPGVTAQRTLVVPAPPAGTAPATVLLTAAATIPSCFFGDTTDPTVKCAAYVARGSEDGTVIDRELTLATGADYTASLWARPRAGANLDALLDGLVDGAPTVTASSVAFPDPAARPGAAVDGDPDTTWRASADDPTPTLHLSWATPQTLTGLHIELADSVAALGTPVGAVTVIAGGQQIEGTLTNGALTFATPLTTTSVTVQLQPGTVVTARDPYQDKNAALPVAISELTFTGAPASLAVDPDRVVDLPCGSGPTLALGGRTISTALHSTVADLVQQREVAATVCDAGPTDLGAGQQRVIASASDLALPTRVALVPTPIPAATATGPATAPAGSAATSSAVHIDQWGDTDRLVTVDPHDTDLLMAVRENTNVGWVATIGGVTLTPVVLDGWQQGWVVPAGLSGQLELRYAPDSLYRDSLLVGGVLALLVVVAALVPWRRRPPAAGTGVGAHTGRALPLIVGGAALIIAEGVPGMMIVAVGVAALIYQTRASTHSPSPAGTRSSRDLGRLWEWLPATGRWASLRPWARLAPWLLPGGLFMVAGAAWVVVDDSNYNRIPQIIAVLALGWLWLETLVTAPRRH